MPTLAEVEAEVRFLAAHIEGLFVDEVRLTVIVRNCSRDNSNMVISNEEDWGRARRVLEGEGIEGI